AVVELAVGGGRTVLRGLRERPLHGAHELAQVEGLRQVLERAALRRLDSSQQRVLGAHHDHPELRPELFDPRDEVEAVLVRHHHGGDDQVALAVLHPAPERRGVAGALHFIAEPPECLAEHCADRAVVVGDQDGRTRVHFSPSLAAMGRNIRKTVRRGALSNSIPPPWSSITLATNARPRPVPLCLVVTKGSNRWGRRSSGMPAPLSATSTTSGRCRRVSVPETASRTPCW